MGNGDKLQQEGSYVLATGAAAAPRLRLLDEIFGPGSRKLLTNAGLREGYRIADIGCGTGLMTLWMAHQVGPLGSVCALDISGEQLRIAEENARSAGLQHVSFHEASAYDTRLPHASFDLVYSRFLMCHLTRPNEALTEMRVLLKVGGVLVCEDFEMGAVRTCPQTRAYERLVEVSRRVDAKRGVDSDIGLKLHSLFLDAEFQRPQIGMHQPAFLRGEAKRFWEVALREAAPAIVGHGAASVEELEDLFTQFQTIAQDNATLVLIARVFQIWARKD